MRGRRAYPASTTMALATLQTRRGQPHDGRINPVLQLYRHKEHGQQLGRVLI
jgi:hypothetical protein